MRGKAIRRDGCIGLRRDHPRVCGEKYQLGVVKPLHEGSPPRMRGKAYKGADQTTRRGITPAYAGKSLVRAKHTVIAQDHPRVCGEKACATWRGRTALGSPPRMRGKVTMNLYPHDIEGITPAYAGKSSLACCPWRLHRDHPRVCGEKVFRPSRGWKKGGSPPRMRGKEGQPGRVERGTGITPAYAGKRRQCPLGELICRDHPRVCGEKTYADRAQMSHIGSPPRMRGKV